MDFWDLTKLLFRRWYVVAPLLLLTALAVLWTSSNVSPKYLANSWIQVVPPTVVTQAKPGESTVNVNPWLNLGLQSLANAATVQVQDEAILNGESVTITVSGANATIKVEIVGNTRDEAKAKSDAIVDRIEQRIKELQSAYAVVPDEYITTKRLDLGVNIEESNGNVNKAIIVVGAVGVLATAALTIGYDALMRQRSRRRRGGGPAAPASVADHPISPMVAPSPMRSGHATTDAGWRDVASPPAARFPSVQASSAIAPGPASEQPAERPGDSELRPDSTVVLPLSIFKRQ